jgi:hypothetical protein
MPKVKKPVSRKLRQLAAEFKDEMIVLVSDTNSSNFTVLNVNCRCCGVTLGNDSQEMKRWAVTQHIKSAKHLKNKDLSAKQQTLEFKKDTFFGDICQVRIELILYLKIYHRRSLKLM